MGTVVLRPAEASSYESGYRIARHRRGYGLAFRGCRVRHLPACWGGCGRRSVSCSRQPARAVRLCWDFRQRYAPKANNHVTQSFRVPGGVGAGGGKRLPAAGRVVLFFGLVGIVMGELFGMFAHSFELLLGYQGEYQRQKRNYSDCNEGKERHRCTCSFQGYRALTGDVRDWNCQRSR